MIPRHLFGACVVLALAILFAGRADCQEIAPANEVKDLSFYRQFLQVADYALRQKDGAETARRVLDLCPKELRQFEWHYLAARADRAPRTFKGHKETVRAVVFSPDGKTLASTGNEATIKLWDVASGAVRHTLESKGHILYCLAFHPDGKILASGSWYNNIELWDGATGKNVTTLKLHNDAVSWLAYSADGAWLASFSRDKTLCIFDVKNAKIKTVCQDNEITCTRLSIDGKHLAYGRTDGSIRLLSMPDLKLEKSFGSHAGAITDLAFHADGRRVISTGADAIRLWDFQTGKLVQSLANLDEAATLVCNRQGTALATIDKENKVKVWYEPFDKPAQFFDVPSWPKFVAFSPSGRTLAVAGPDATIRLHDLTEEADLVKTPEPIWSLQPGKDRVLVSMRRGAAVLISDSSQPRTLEGHRGQVRAIVMQPQGKLLATAGQDRIVKIWDGAGTRVIHNLPGHKGLIRALAFDAAGKYLASASEDQTIKIWDAAAGTEVKTLKGHKDMVTSVAFLPKAKLLASASGDGTVKIWDLATGATRSTWEAHDDVASHLVVSPDGTRLASAGTDHKVKIWDVATGKALHTLPAQTSLTQGLAFSPNGKRLAVAGMNGVTLFDPELGQEVYTFGRLAGPVNAVAFSPDGTQLFSGSYEGGVMRWLARPRD